MRNFSWVIVIVLAVLLQIANGSPQKRSVVGKQTWGYVEVRPGAFMFWWLYYTTGTETYTKTPLVLWLQGGPGASSTGYGNFEEIGPQDVNLKNRSISWVNHTNVLFVDNPVGTGFSYVNDTKLLVKDNDQIADDLMALIGGFLQKVPEFQAIPLYIFSESYGGKMAALFALRLNKAITAGKIKCNLKSVSLGDSWISPIDSVLTWAPFLFSTSFVDNAGFAAINKSAYGVKDALDKQDFKKATSLWDLTEDLVSRTTNGVSFYNILESETTTNCSSKNYSSDGKSVRATSHLAAYHSDPLATLMNGKIKEMLRIIPPNVTWGGQSKLVFDALEGDFMKPVIRVVESLLNNTPIAVNVYNGQLDLIVDTMGTTRWVERMAWLGIPGWKNSKRRPIILNGKTEGFVKSFKTFNFYWILKAGHMVPQDSPETGVELLQLITGVKK